MHVFYVDLVQCQFLESGFKKKKNILLFVFFYLRFFVVSFSIRVLFYILYWCTWATEPSTFFFDFCAFVLELIFPYLVCFVLTIINIMIVSYFITPRGFSCTVNCVFYFTAQEKSNSAIGRDKLHKFCRQGPTP